MAKTSPDNRAEALIASPAGCVLLLLAEEQALTPADLAKPEIGLFAIAAAVGEISPWRGMHDQVLAEALRHGPRLRNRALELAAYPGTAWWWGPIDRENQLWLPQHDGFICPDEVWELRPRDKPNPHERYVHEPRPLISTSNLRGSLSPELAHVIGGSGDWDLEFPINVRHVAIRPTAHVLEINSAQEWHDLVRRYPADGFHAFHPDDVDTPWGVATGMVVPDWRQVSFDWDGVHITPWAFLTATQVRVTSDIGWTEPWAWEGAHTVWLDWMFDHVDDLPPITEDTFQIPAFWTDWLHIPGPGEVTNMVTNSPPDAAAGGGAIAVDRFGEVDGEIVERYSLANDNGVSVSILTYGGVIQSLVVPDRSGRRENVALGFGSIGEYVEHSPYFGAIVGRFANRIAHGRFTLDGTEYQVPVNNGPNSLHGGLHGFDRKVWKASIAESGGVPKLVLSLLSPDGEEGYPGNLVARVTYALSANNALTIAYEATTDAPTVLNLSNHCYFNLGGEGSGDILRHAVQMRASRYTPVSETLIPTGEIAPVAGTPFDFTEARVIGERIDQAGDPQLAIAGGYDHNFVIDRDVAGSSAMVHIARVIDPASGRVMDVATDQPGVQFYTGNFLTGSFAGTSGRVYERRSGFCLETQHFPDSPNQPGFPSTVLRQGDAFRSVTTFSFGVLP